MTNDGGRFSRWSQRKAAARRGGALPAEAKDAVAPARPAEADRPAVRGPQQAVPETPAVTAGPDAAPATAEAIAALPPIEGLTFQSDFTGFMAKGIPEALKQAALRKLWTSDPVLANLDGLCDYNEDHHLIDTSITLDQTGYKVGKGYFDEAAEKVAELGDARPTQAGEGSERDFDSSVNGEQAEEMDKTPGEIVAAVEETPAATRPAAATVPTDESSATNEDEPS